MDIRLFLTSAFCAVSGVCIIGMYARQGWKGFKNTNATRSQRAIDLAGCMAFLLLGLVFSVLGVVGMIVTPFLSEKPDSMTTMSPPPVESSK